MTIKTDTTYRGLLLKANANKWFWPSYITSTVLLILVPIMMGWGNFSGLSMIGMMVALFGLCVVLASGYQLFKYNISTVFFFIFLAWFHSSPTEGIGTYFYTDSQVERFKQAEEVRSFGPRVKELIRDRSSSYQQLKYSDLKPYNPESFDSEITIREDNGNIEIKLKDVPKDIIDQ